MSTTGTSNGKKRKAADLDTDINSSAASHPRTVQTVSGAREARHQSVENLVMAGEVKLEGRQPRPEGGRRPLIIGFYNYKGGIGKTSVAINTASTLCLRGDNVLMVDGDQQGNMSAFFLSPQDAPESDAEDAGSSVPYVETSFDAEANRAVAPRPPRPPAQAPDYAAMRAAFRAHTIGSDKLHPKTPPVAFESGQSLFSEANIFNLLNPLFQHERAEFEAKLASFEPLDQTPLQHPGMGKLFLIPADPRTTMWEQEVASALNRVNEVLKLQYLSAFRFALLTICAKHEVDFVVVDLGPNTGCLNEMFALSCDVLVPPTQPNLFSLHAVDNLLNTILPKWRSDHQRCLESSRALLRASSTYAAYALNPNFPLIAPFLVCGFKPCGTVTTDSTAWIKAIQKAVSDYHSRNVNEPPPRGGQTIPVHDLFTMDVDKMVVPFLRGDTALFQHADRNKVPVVWIRSNELKARAKLAIKSFADLAVHLVAIRNFL